MRNHNDVIISYYLKGEWPEVYRIALKLKSGGKLDSTEKEWIKELAEAGGWSVEDIVEDLKHIDDPLSKRAERYKEIHEKYLEEAMRLKKACDTRQAGEKIWGAVTTLIKLYAARKEVPIVHWSRGRLDSFITNNLEERYRKQFRDLLDRANALHEHFYEGHLDPKTFEERRKELIKLIEKARKLVLSSARS